MANVEFGAYARKSGRPVARRLVLGAPAYLAFLLSFGFAAALVLGLIP